MFHVEVFPCSMPMARMSQLSFLEHKINFLEYLYKLSKITALTVLAREKGKEPVKTHLRALSPDKESKY